MVPLTQIEQEINVSGSGALRNLDVLVAERNNEGIWFGCNTDNFKLNILIPEAVDGISHEMPATASYKKCLLFHGQIPLLKMHWNASAVV